MSDEEKLDEVSTASPATETVSDVATKETGPDIVQKDNEGNRRSIKDTLRAAFDEQKREPSKARQAAATQRSRAEDGKFAEEKTETPAKVEPRLAPEAKPESATEIQPVEPMVASKPIIDAPTSWSQEAKATWASLPPAVQQAAQKREKEVSDGFAQYKTKTEDIDRAFGPQRDSQLQQLGKTRGEAINQLFHWHDALSNPQTRVQAFRALAQSHGLDPATLAPQTGQVQQQTPTDPNQVDIQQLLQTQLQQHLQPVLQRVGSFEQQLQQERMAKAQGELASFSQDKPHFEKVRNAMAQMIGSGYATNLDDAYQKATWADPEIRGDILAQENAKREAEAKAAQEAAQVKAAQAEDERKRKEREAADKARRANISVRSSTAAGMPNAASNKLGKSVRDSLADTLRDARAS